MVLTRLTYFLEQHSILSPVQAGLRPGRLIVDQVLLLSKSIADSFHQSKPGARTVLATVDFSKAFDSVWHSALLFKLPSLSLPLCFINGYDLISQIPVQKSASVIPIVVLSVFKKVFLKVQFLNHSFFSLLINDPPTFLLASLANSNPHTRLKKGSWKFFSRSHNLTPNLHLACEPLILCPPKPPWSNPSSYTISLQLSFSCSRNDPSSLHNDTATSHLSSLPTATSLPGLIIWFLAGWGRVVQGFTLIVQSESLLPPSPYRLDSGPPATVTRPMPFFTLLSGVFLTPRHVRLNLSPYSLILYLSCQPSPFLYST